MRARTHAHTVKLETRGTSWEEEGESAGVEGGEQSMEELDGMARTSVSLEKTVDWLQKSEAVWSRDIPEYGHHHPQAGGHE